MAWRIKWRRDGGERNFALMRDRVELWTDESDRVLLEAPPDGWEWGELVESADEGPRVEWHHPPTDVELVRDGEVVEGSDDAKRSWALEPGDELRFGVRGTCIEIVATSVSTGADMEFVPRPSSEVRLEEETVRAMWDVHCRLARGAGWQRLFDELEAWTPQLTGIERTEGIGALIWEGEQEFYQRVIWHDGSETDAEGPREPDALASLMTREPTLSKALRDRREVVVRRHKKGAIDLLLPIGDDEFLGAYFLAASIDDSFEPRSSWRLVDQFGDAGELLIRRHRNEAMRRSIEEENRYFRTRQRRHYLVKDLVCESEEMRSVYDELHERVDEETPILLTGEAGVGKELLARALHHLGERRDGMLIRMDCANFPRELVDFELFGCVASELTGAVAARKGIFELAEGGTVFLDEVDRLSPMIQGKLARVLKEKEVRRLGDAVGRPVDTRLIVSSHRDLDELCDRGMFRADLYELLASHRLDVPPLRRRTADILPLARIFLKKFTTRYEPECRVLGEELKQWLTAYRWPGNVRQLQTVIEAVVLVARDKKVVDSRHLAMAGLGDGTTPKEPTPE